MSIAAPPIDNPEPSRPPASRSPRLLVDIPRRSQIDETPEMEAPARSQTFRLPQPRLSWVLRRAAVWASALFTFALGVLSDRLHRKRRMHDVALRLCAVLERMDGLSVRFGRLLGMRIDLLPFEVCMQLYRLRDRMPELPFAYAVGRIERAIGRRIEAVFRVFDPTPIDSDAFACLYQAVLHDGQKVVVKVRRPSAAEWVSADLLLMSLLTRVAEALTIVRTGFFEHLRSEMYQVAAAELDFVSIARFHRLFRLYTQKEKLRYATAAKVYSRYCSEDVIVSEFVSGVYLGEIVAACQQENTQFLNQLALMNIQPRKVAQRVLQIAWWTFFENLFFDASPHPYLFVVRPGNNIVFISFGHSGKMSEHNRRLMLEVLASMSKCDVEHCAEAMVQSISPMPLIDVYEFTKTLELNLWTQYFSLIDKQTPWWNRTSAGMWLTLVNVAKASKVPLHLDLIRFMRASLTYDVIAGQIWPELSWLKEYRRYLLKADRRRVRQIGRDLLKMQDQGMLTQLVAKAAEAKSSADRIAFWLESFSRRIPIQFLSVTGKGAYSISLLLRFAFNSAALVLSLLSAGVAYRLFRGHGLTVVDVEQLAARIVQHPIVMLWILILLVLTVRRMQFRLGDKDQNE